MSTYMAGFEHPDSTPCAPGCPCSRQKPTMTGGASNPNFFDNRTSVEEQETP